MTQPKQPAIQGLSYNPADLDAVVHRFSLRLVAVFGSYARHDPPPGPDSDLDIAVLGCRRELVIECLDAFGEVFPRVPIDLVRLEDADPLFRQEIMESAVRLAGDPDLFYEYRAFAYRDYIDSADLFALEQTLFRKKMTRLRERLS